MTTNFEELTNQRSDGIPAPGETTTIRADVLYHLLRAASEMVDAVEGLPAFNEPGMDPDAYAAKVWTEEMIRKVRYGTCGLDFLLDLQIEAA